MGLQLLTCTRVMVRLPFFSVSYLMYITDPENVASDPNPDQFLTFSGYSPLGVKADVASSTLYVSSNYTLFSMSLSGMFLLPDIPHIPPCFT